MINKSQCLVCIGSLGTSEARCHPDTWFSECGPQSTSITWKHTRNANTLVASQACCTRKPESPDLPVTATPQGGCLPSPLTKVKPEGLERQTCQQLESGKTHWHLAHLGPAPWGSSALPCPIQPRADWHHPATRAARGEPVPSAVVRYRAGWLHLGTPVHPSHINTKAERSLPCFPLTPSPCLGSHLFL